MKIDISIGEAEVIIDGLNLLQAEINRYEADELIPSMVREGERVFNLCERVKSVISEELVEENE